MISLVIYLFQWAFVVVGPSIIVPAVFLVVMVTVKGPLNPILDGFSMFPILNTILVSAGTLTGENTL